MKIIKGILNKLNRKIMGIKENEMTIKKDKLFYDAISGKYYRSDTDKLDRLSVLATENENDLDLHEFNKLFNSRDH